MASLLALFLGAPPWFCAPRSAPADPPPGEGPGGFLFTEGTIHDFHLTISDEAMDGLGRDNPDVRATLTYQGVNLDVGLKLKGSSTYRGIDGKASFKIDIGEFVEDQTLLGVRRLTLNSMVFDPTMLREHTVYELYDAVGVPAPRHGYARVFVNGEWYGLYGIVETMDEQFLRRRFAGDSEGNLYDSTFTFADLTNLGVANYELQEGEPVAPYDDLYELVADLDQRDIVDVLDARFDRDAVLGMLAVDLASGNWDGYSRNTNNYLLYHATTEDRWYFIPWGQDFAFQGGGFLYQGVRGRIASACLASGTCKALLDERVRGVLDQWEHGDLLGFAERTWSTIGWVCEDDPKKEQGCDPDHLFDALTDRLESLRRELP